MPQTEWANSPATTAHPDPEEVQAPEADVNQSLRQYLNADPHPVKVVEGEEKVFEDHEVEDMMAKFKEYLNEDETVEEAKVGTPNSLEKVEAQIKKLKDMAQKAKDDGDPQKANTIQSSDEMTELLRKQKKLKNESIEEAQVSEEPNEDNAFNTAAAQAKKAGKSEFEFNGKKYKVKMDDKTADALTDSVEPKVESQDIADLKKLAGIGETTTDQTVSADISALKKLAGI